MLSLLGASDSNAELSSRDICWSISQSNWACAALPYREKTSSGSPPGVGPTNPCWRRSCSQGGASSCEPYRLVWASSPISRPLPIPEQRLHSISPPRSAKLSGPIFPRKEMPSDFAPFSFLRDNFGLVPNLFQVQALCPAAVAAEVEAMRLILLTDDVLKRKQKERILLAVSGSNQNTYCVAMYAEILTLLGVAAEESYQIAADHRQAGLSELDNALLDFAVKLSARPEEFSFEDVESLRRQGLSDEQILEAVAVTALTQFLNTVQQGTGAVPDFAPRQSFHLDIGNKANLSYPDSRPSRRDEPPDPDAELVRKAQAGDLRSVRGTGRAPWQARLPHTSRPVGQS